MIHILTTCMNVKVEPIEFDAKFIHDPESAAASRSWCPGCASAWEAWGSKTKTEAKTQAREQQAPEGKDTRARSKSSFLAME